MKIAIDISQIVYQGTGVAKYTQKLIENLLELDQKNEYLLFGSSLRKRKLLTSFADKVAKKGHVQVKLFPLPPLLLEFLWNRLHFLAAEWLIGKVDVFFSSDWLQPPTRAKKVTTLHDLIVYKHPESFQPRGGHNIVVNQRRRLKWVKKECDLVICDSEATKKDAIEILKISEKKLKVVYPGGVS